MKSGPGQGFRQFRQMYVRFFVALPPESQNSVWSALNATADHCGEMHAEKWKVGVGHWID
jgi:hypothetical protein